LARFPDVTPEFEDRTLEIAAADKIIAGRFRLDALGCLKPGLLDSRRRRLAPGEKKQSEENIEGDEETKRAIDHGQLHLSQRCVARNLWSALFPVPVSCS
jgi:hypothetical protein